VNAYLAWQIASDGSWIGENEAYGLRAVVWRPIRNPDYWSWVIHSDVGGAPLHRVSKCASADAGRAQAEAFASICLYPVESA
jgi:hypothetical protein